MKPAFLVEGVLEKEFLSQACPGAAIRRVVINGNSVSIGAIAERIAPHYRLLSEQYFQPIVVVLDRENRRASWKTIKAELATELKRHDISDVIIGVCDRKIENWILCDSEGVGIGASDSPETAGGKGEIGRRLGTYHETTDGVRLLKKARASEIRRKSQSFADLYDNIRHLPCWWLSR